MFSFFGTIFCAVAAIVLLHPAVASNVYDVKAFGAKGDGATFDTNAVRAAAAALAKNGYGTLLFPSNGTYLTGSFNISSNAVVEIETGARVLGSTRGQDWPLVNARAVWPQFGHGSDCVPGSQSCFFMHQSLMFSWNATNITIQGNGTFDCNAQPDTWWKCAHNLTLPPCNGYGRPHCVMFANATDVEMKNITVANSPDWTLHFSSCTRVHVHDLRVLNPLEPNADGIDIDSSQDVLVEDNYFSVGDDALCVKSGIDYFGRTYGRPAKNILFRRNVIGTGHGITIGSEMSGGVNNVTFEDIHMVHTGTGIRMKSQRGRGGVVSDVTYRNITMESIEGQCVQITLNYHAGIPPTNKTGTPVFNGIVLENVQCISAKNSYFIDGLDEQHILALALRNVTMGAKVGPEARCDYAECTCDAFTNPCPSCCTTADYPVYH
eukprot:m.227352 g.227352  ORF g.227352 m.227352 type:complete len:435 (+) comp19235_c0_seq1:177-1481(+)